MRAVPSRALGGLTLFTALVGAGCASGSADSPTSAGARPAPGAPPVLRRLQDQGTRLLDGGPQRFRRELAALRGYPIVVNQWASWCGPCRFEFPFFQRLANRYGNRVAFLGVNSRDASGPAKRFLEEFPTPYPHFSDPDAQVARVFRGGVAWPTTAYYDSRGRLTRTHAGSYASQARLEQDVRRYALRE